MKGEVRFTLRGNVPSDRTDEPPTRFKIANWGLSTFRTGKVLVNEEAVRTIRSRMAAARRDRVQIDVCHRNAFKPGPQQEPESTLGYADLEDVPNDGLYLCNATWTDRGKAVWKALPDPSPAFLARKQDHMMTFLDSVGLCPNGELELPTLCSADSPSSPNNNLYLKTVTPEAMNQLLCQLLKKAGVKIPDKGEMSDDEYSAALMAAATEHLEGADAMPEEEKPEMLNALDQRMKKLELADAERAAAAEKAGKEEILRLCSAEGKVMPLTNDQIFGTATVAATPLPVLQSIYGNLKKTVEIGTQQQRQGDKPAEVKVTLSAEDLKILAVMGVKPEEAEKFCPVA